MIFRTYSGSLYELDQEQKRIRRVFGTRPAQKYQGKDCEWKTYIELFPEIPKLDRPLIIVWECKVDDEIIVRTTQTSLITEFISEKEMS